MMQRTATIGRTATNASARSTIARSFWRNRWMYLCLLPMLAFLVVFSYYPALGAISYAFYDFDGVDKHFIGFDNFRTLTSDPTFRHALGNLGQLALFHIIIGVWVPFLVAELIFHVVSRRAQYAYRVLFVVPMIVPSVAIILIWKFIYEPNVGVLNTFLRAVGLGALAHPWLGSSQTALLAVMGVGFPWVSPFALLVCFAGLQTIPQEVRDAAVVDGCTGFRRIVRIDIPLVLGQIKVITILQLIAAFQTLVSVLIMTDGGPADATMVPSVYMYKTAFYYYKMGYASAIGVLLLIAVFALTALSMSYKRPALEHEV